MGVLVSFWWRGGQHFQAPLPGGNGTGPPFRSLYLCEKGSPIERGILLAPQCRCVKYVPSPGLSCQVGTHTSTLESRLLH